MLAGTSYRRQNKISQLLEGVLFSSFPDSQEEPQVTLADYPYLIITSHLQFQMATIMASPEGLGQSPRLLIECLLNTQ